MVGFAAARAPIGTTLLFDVRDLDDKTRGAIIDVLGHEAAVRGFNRDGTPNQLGRDLDELADALLDDIP